MGLKESGLRGSLRNVSVGIGAIPDSEVSRWNMVVQDGGTGDDFVEDEVGDNDLIVEESGFSTVTGSEYVDGEAIDFSGGGRLVAERPVGVLDPTIDGPPLTIAATIEITSLSSDDVVWVQKSPDGNERTGLGFPDTGTMQYRSNDDAFGASAHHDDFDTNQRIRTQSILSGTGTARLFVDLSEAAGSGNFPLFSAVGFNNFQVGGQEEENASSAQFGGIIDQISVYESELDSDEREADSQAFG